MFPLNPEFRQKLMPETEENLQLVGQIVNSTLPAECGDWLREQVSQNVRQILNAIRLSILKGSNKPLKNILPGLKYLPRRSYERIIWKIQDLVPHKKVNTCCSQLRSFING